MPADIVELNVKRLKKQKVLQVARDLMSLPAKRRLELIVERPDAQAIVAALDVNDFFHTVQEIGAEDSLQILAMGNVEQIGHLFDLEWWCTDSLEPAKALTWLERLWRAGGHGFNEWLSNADFELLVSLFKRWVAVDIVPEDVDLVEAVENLPPRTLDDLYFWESKYPQFDELITHLLTVIFETNYGFFRELMNSVIYAPASELEETAYHFHRARLEDHDIPDFYDSLEIYRSIAPDEFAVKMVDEGENEDRRIPSFALALVPGGDLLAGVVGRIEDRGLGEMLQMEMAALANKVTVADRVRPDNPEALRQSVEKALAYINLGLELRSEASIERASEIIRENFLEHLFRLAHTKISKIRVRLNSIVRNGWLGRCQAGMKCLEEEWFEVAEELLAATPRVPKSVPAGKVSLTAGPYDFFRTPRDLALADHIVDVIEAVGDIYDLLAAHLSRPWQSLWTEGQVRTPEDVTLGIMVFTASANSLISGIWSCEPFRHSIWAEVFPLLQPYHIERAIIDWVDTSLPDDRRKHLAQAYLAPILRDYESEMRSFSVDNPPDARLVKFFMFSE